jgi:predicted ATPase/DNA-binding SARP family transcriptional activator
MDYRILGPLEVCQDGRPIGLGGDKQRALMAILLLHRGEVVSADRLIDELWGERPPPTAPKSLQVHVSRLRRALGHPNTAPGAPDGVLLTRGHGYLLDVQPGELDVDRFRDLHKDGSKALAAGDPASAARVLREALALWRGPPLADFTYEGFAQQAIGEFEELHVGAIEERVEADLALGRHEELVGELTSLVEGHPLRERVRMQLMLALYRCGREAEALDSYARFRCDLSEELGLDPGPRLQRLQDAILARDPSLDPPLAESSQAGPSPSGAALHTNLPSELSSFVGRERELEQTAALLRRSRLLTLTGVGGVGKTRLALQLAAGAPDDHADGVWWLELAPLLDPALVGTTLVAALRVRPLPGQSETDAAVSYLSGRQALVVFDNCEHLLEPAGRLIEALLRGCRRLRVLATSRQPLGAEGETDWRVPSLSLDADSGRPGEDAVASDAARLFVERAAEVRADFRVSAGNAPAVIGICRAVDGIPLALELAAARVRLLSVEQIAAGLADSLRLLSRGTRTTRPRHQSLRASIAWSHELLDEGEQVLFRRVAVFLGGFTLEAAQQVCSDEALPAPEVLDLLDALVEKSLVQAEPQGSGVRCRLLEPVRQYALERLDDAGEAETLRDCHRDAYLAVAEQAVAEGFGPGIGQQSVLAVLGREAANLRAAFERALVTDGVLALRLAVAIAPWWRAHAHFQEAEEAFARALAAAPPERSSPRVQALSARTWVIANSGAHVRAKAYGQQALAEAEAIGESTVLLGALLPLGTAQVYSDPRRAVETLTRAHELAVAADDEWAIARCETLIGMAAAICRDPDLYHRHTEGLAARLERLGDLETLGLYWTWAADVAHTAGDLQRVRQACRQLLEAGRAIDSPSQYYAALERAHLLDAETGRAGAAVGELRSIQSISTERGLALAPWAVISRATAEAACGDLRAAATQLESLLDDQAGSTVDALIWATTTLAEVLRLQGDGRAGEYAHRGLELARSIDNRYRAAGNQLVLGRLAAARGDWGDAQQLLDEALNTIVDRGYRLELPRALDARAEVVYGLGSHTEASRILGVAAHIRGALGLVPWPAQRAEVDALAARVRDALGDHDFELARRAGTALTDAEALSWMRSERGLDR